MRALKAAEIFKAIRKLLASFSSKEDIMESDHGGVEAQDNHLSTAVDLKK
jgi:hypothetical protein